MQFLAASALRPSQLPARNRSLCPASDRGESPSTLQQPLTAGSGKPSTPFTVLQLSTKTRFPSPFDSAIKTPFVSELPLTLASKSRPLSPWHQAALGPGKQCIPQLPSQNSTAGSPGKTQEGGPSSLCGKLRPATPGRKDGRLGALLPLEHPIASLMKAGSLLPAQASIKLNPVEPHFARSHQRPAVLPPVQAPAKFTQSLCSTGAVQLPVPVATPSYFTELSPLRFDSCRLSQSTPANVNIKRVNAEIKILSADLPCDESAAIFVRVDAFSMSHFQALLTGVEETPYAHGLYLFDIDLPENYPNSPPKVTLLTTGNGSVRFNPNLYNNGYLCLSIINTWRGEADESWDPNMSSLYQVLLSVQSLVMTANIANKEPGYEDLDVDSLDNKVYTAVVRYANMKYAMAKMIKRPPAGFEEVVRQHFALKKEKIMAETQRWTSDSVSIQSVFSSAPLAKSQNQNIIHLFSQKGVYSCLSEATREVSQALVTV